MDLERAPRDIVDVTAKRFLHDREGDLIPGNGVEREQLDFKAFFTDPEFR